MYDVSVETKNWQWFRKFDVPQENNQFSGTKSMKASASSDRCYEFEPRRFAESYGKFALDASGQHPRFRVVSPRQTAIYVMYPTAHDI